LPREAGRQGAVNKAGVIVKDGRTITSQADDVGMQSLANEAT